jgi:GTPase SAR1 family protein
MEEKIIREVIQLGTLGDSGVGKSNLSSVYVNNKFEPEIIATIGFNCLIKDTIIKINNIEKKLK